MAITNEQAHAIAGAAIAFEQAKATASDARKAADNLRSWDWATHDYVYTDNDSSSWQASDYHAHELQLERDRKRRAYQKALKAAMAGATS